MEVEPLPDGYVGSRVVARATDLPSGDCRAGAPPSFSCESESSTEATGMSPWCPAATHKALRELGLGSVCNGHLLSGDRGLRSAITLENGVGGRGCMKESLPLDRRWDQRPKPETLATC